MRQGITTLREPQELIPPVAIGTPLVRKEKCPRRPAATITTLTAATGEVLTEFMGFHPTDLGHHEAILGRRVGQRATDLKLVQLAPARPPCVFNMLETRSEPRGIDLNGNDIEPDIHFRQAHAEEKVGSDELNFTTLAQIDRQLGNAEGAASSSLDLNKRYKISLPHNEVDFSSSEPDILGKDLPPPTL